jgi:predicted AAA+ superfamily ATPase
MIERSSHLRAVERLLSRFPVVGLLGARQVGKTTLASAIGRAFDGAVTRFDLEDPAAVARLADPMLALGGLEGLVILDEIQHRPDLLPASAFWRIAAPSRRGSWSSAVLRRNCFVKARSPWPGALHTISCRA